MNMSDLQMILGLSYSMNNSTLSENKDMDSNLHGSFSKVVCPFAAGEQGGDVLFVSGARPRMSRRHSMENLELMNLTPDKMNVRTESRLCLPSASGSLLARSLVCFLIIPLFTEGSEAEQRHPDQTVQTVPG